MPAKDMRVPLRNARGFLRYFLKVASSQVKPEFFIALEYLNFGTLAALRPMIPWSDGPTLFFPAFRAWQALHLL